MRAHRLFAKKNKVEVLEISYGTFDEKDEIRLEDVYGRNKIIAVDLGGTNTRVGLVKGNRVLKYIKEKTPDNKKDLMKLLSGLIRGLMSKDVKGIGVASPGPLKRWDN